ncbi:hypothetical protein RUESEDTHA_03158 [Ruegeria sp. THAF57]|uniref:hypothetical protein n=1 Tax=Ruegeria sp. THAF57 TaxID=2744555 RepID=UPI0015DEE77A|nr:hypothetical protein [Ruegeria sp. THAF57]CAD0186251.1 hypothetical protein RUESEDTHA_03158 [Ruegeria sp. THAF57]
MPSETSKGCHSSDFVQSAISELNIECLCVRLGLDDEKAYFFKTGLKNIFEEAEVLYELKKELKEAGCQGSFNSRDRSVRHESRKNLEELSKALNVAAEHAKDCDWIVDELFISSDTSFLLGALTTSEASKQIFSEVALSSTDERSGEFPNIERELLEYRDVASNLDPQHLRYVKSPIHSLSEILKVVASTLSRDLEDTHRPKGRGADKARNHLLRKLFDLYEEVFDKPPPIREDGPFVDLCTETFSQFAKLGSSKATSEFSELKESAIKRYVKQRRQSSD